ncbi:MAG: fructosamine kinase family protein, partial [Luteibaculum sp.]
MEGTLNALCLRANLGNLITYEAVSGGSINQAYKVKCDKGTFFLKYNPSAPEDFFNCEAKGLKALGKHLSTPKIIFIDQDFLVLSYLQLGALGNQTQARAGEQLAELHKQESQFFGWTNNNYIGSLPQKNKKLESGRGFYGRYRFMPLVKSCFELGALSPADLKNAEKVMQNLYQIFPDEKAVLLHGDLWSGNIGEANGQVYFFDPAIYYGYRETDLAMTRLFGGFSSRFYQAYQSSYPLSPGWED